MSRSRADPRPHVGNWVRTPSRPRIAAWPRDEDAVCASCWTEGERSFSFEFFPPRDEAGEEQLWAAIRALEPYRPTFVSVTYGAGGTTRDKTVGITGRIARDTPLTPVAHLTCVGHTREELERILDAYAAEGIEHVMLLRGDPSDGPRAEWTPTEAGSPTPSSWSSWPRSRGDFRIGVAAFPEGHPGASSRDADADVLVAKANAGAEFAVTQMFFRASDYFELVERVRARGADIPILPGIMPILNLNAIRRQGELIGTDVPADLVERISVHDGDPAAMRAEGIAIAAELCEELLDGRRPGAALLHAEPVQGDAGDLRRAQHDRLTRYSVEGCAPSPSPVPAPRPPYPTPPWSASPPSTAPGRSPRPWPVPSPHARRWSRLRGTWWSRPSTSRCGPPTSRARYPGSRRGTP